MYDFFRFFAAGAEDSGPKSRTARRFAAGFRAPRLWRRGMLSCRQHIPRRLCNRQEMNWTLRRLKMRGWRSALFTAGRKECGRRDTRCPAAGLRAAIAMWPAFDEPPDEMPSPQCAPAMDGKRDCRLVDSGREKVNQCSFTAKMKYALHYGELTIAALISAGCRIKCVSSGKCL